MGNSSSRGGAPDKTGVIEPNDEASKAFIKGLVANGQAAKPLPDGSLPPGATHEIIGETASGLPIVKRRRVSAF
jgi:hypothetical protein